MQLSPPSSGWAGTAASGLVQKEAATRCLLSINLIHQGEGGRDPLLFSVPWRNGGVMGDLPGGVMFEPKSNWRY